MKRKRTEATNEGRADVPSAENLSMAWVSVRKFPVDLDIWWIQKQMLGAGIFQVRPPTPVLTKQNEAKASHHTDGIKIPNIKHWLIVST